MSSQRTIEEDEVKLVGGDMLYNQQEVKDNDELAHSLPREKAHF